MEFDCLDIDACVGFDWDKGNLYKNEKKHGIKWQEIEEMFFNVPLILLEDRLHSADECRCFALGKTDEDLSFFVVFNKNNS